MAHILKSSIIISVAFFAALQGGSSFSQTLKEENSNYEIIAHKDFWLKLNKTTGKISTCKMVSEQLVCRVAADERQSFVDEISRLESKIAALESKLKTNHKEDHDLLENLSEEKLDKKLDKAKIVLRKFFEFAKELQSEVE